MSENIHINHDFKDMFLYAETPFAIMSVGLPGSGKTVYMQELARRVDAAYIHPGNLRNEEWAREQIRHGIQPQDVISGYIRRLIAEGAPVVIDSHHSHPQQRASTNKMVRDLGIEVVAAVNFKLSLPDALQQVNLGCTSASEKQIRELDKIKRRFPLRYNETPPFDLILDQHGLDGESVIRPFSPKK